MFKYETSIQMHDTDAVGLVYFANVPRMAHQAFEAFLESYGCPLSETLRPKNAFLPVVHMECDYKLPISIGDHLAIEIRCKSIRDSSFMISYRFLNEAGEIAAKAEIVHVAILGKTWKKVTLPARLRSVLGHISE